MCKAFRVPHNGQSDFVCTFLRSPVGFAVGVELQRSASSNIQQADFFGFYSPAYRG